MQILQCMKKKLYYIDHQHGCLVNGCSLFYFIYITYPWHFPYLKQQRKHKMQFYCLSRPTCSSCLWFNSYSFTCNYTSKYFINLLLLILPMFVFTWQIKQHQVHARAVVISQASQWEDTSCVTIQIKHPCNFYMVRTTILFS